MSDCIFCRIVAGEIPCHKVLETDRVLAFLDIGPLADGHTLVIPKAHAATLDELPEADATACMAVIPTLSRAIVEATGCPAWNLLQNNGPLAGQEVDHVHFHLIPRHADDGLGYRWLSSELDPTRAASLLEAIKSAL